MKPVIKECDVLKEMKHDTISKYTLLYKSSERWDIDWVKSKSRLRSQYSTSEEEIGTKGSRIMRVEIDDKIFEREGRL